MSSGSLVTTYTDTHTQRQRKVDQQITEILNGSTKVEQPKNQMKHLKGAQRREGKKNKRDAFITERGVLTNTHFFFSQFIL